MSSTTSSTTSPSMAPKASSQATPREATFPDDRTAPPPGQVHSSAFMEVMIRFLMPYFLPICADSAAARTEILQTLASYRTRTRSAMLSAAQVIAFGFATLDTLSEAKTTEMSPSMRLRFRGCANNLNRSAEKTEQMLERQNDNSAPKPARPPAEPVNDVSDTDAEAAIQFAKTRIETYRNQTPGKRSPILPSRSLPPEEQADNTRLWGNAMINVLAEMGMPVQPVAPK